MNLYEISRTYRRTVRMTADSSGTVRLALDIVRAGRRRVLSHVTVENQTTAFTKARLAISRTNVIHYLDELDSPGAGELAVSRSDIILEELDRFYAELTGVTAGDKCVMSAVGWEADL